MLKKVLPLVLQTGAIALTVLDPGNARTPAAPAAVAAQTYRPGLGDLMTTTVQPRHTTLGRAAREKNWVYAAYELHDLLESFDRTACVWPMYRKSNIAECSRQP